VTRSILGAVSACVVTTLAAMAQPGAHLPAAPGPAARVSSSGAVAAQRPEVPPAARQAAPPPASASHAWHPTAEESRLAAEARELLNSARRKAGVPPLQGRSQLDLFAYQHAREMALRGSVTHFSYRFGLSTGSRVKLAFPNVYQFGENVAANRDVRALHEALMNSAGHRLNRMDADFTHVGIGIARANDYQLYQTEVFARVPAGEDLGPIAVLYTEVAPSKLQRDEPHYGEIIGETVRIGPPGEDNPEYWTRRGIDAFDQGRYAAAVDLFRRSLEIDPGYEYASYNLARAYLADGRAAAALEILERQTAQRPDDADAWSSRGAALLLLQRYEAAERAFRRVLELRTRDPGSWYNLGLALEMQGRVADAERAYRQALHEDPDLRAASSALARVRR